MVIIIASASAWRFWQLNSSLQSKKCKTTCMFTQGQVLTYMYLAKICHIILFTPLQLFDSCSRLSYVNYDKAVKPANNTHMIGIILPALSIYFWYLQHIFLLLLLYFTLRHCYVYSSNCNSAPCVCVYHFSYDIYIGYMEKLYGCDIIIHSTRYYYWFLSSNPSCRVPVTPGKPSKPVAPVIHRYHSRSHRFFAVPNPSDD